MNKIFHFLKNNFSKVLFIVAIGIFLVVLALGLIYLYLRLTSAVSDFSQLVHFPFAKDDIVETIVSDPPLENAAESDQVLKELDPGQIQMLNPTRENGRVWSSNWTDGNNRTLISGKRDPFDDQLIARGNGTVTIDGDGIAKLAGDAPRMYVYDVDKKLKWDDVEVTVYAKRISESGTLSSQGIVIGARSEHQDASLENPCAGATYYGRLLFDGRAVFQKEVIHEGAYSTNKPAERNIATWKTTDGAMPKNVWIGVKFVIKTNTDGKSVKLELYRDLTDGHEGGKWEKVAEFTDRGDWSIISSEDNVQKKCGYASNKVLTKPGTSVFIRNDMISNMQYKLFSIREIE